MPDGAKPNGTIPVTVLTGFFGSGKTHLIRRFLESETLTNAAFIVNEFGEIGLDHQLIQSSDDDVVLMNNGCVCCSVLDNLAGVLKSLWEKRALGQIPEFERVVIETTGLADPSPILTTLLMDPVVRNFFHPSAIVTTVDPLVFDSDLARSSEFINQVASADILVVTKDDVIADGEVDAAVDGLSLLNSSAEILRASECEEGIFISGTSDTRSPEGETLNGWLKLKAPPKSVFKVHSDISSIAIDIEGELDWTKFSIWFSLFLHRFGDKVFRVKGMLKLSDKDGPVILNSVRHNLYPPYHIAEWPADHPRSYLVFIGRGLDKPAIAAALGQLVVAPKVRSADQSVDVGPAIPAAP